MMSFKTKLVRAAAATTAVGAVAAAALAGSPAQADPIQYTGPLYGYGSDTIQDVTNAFAGFSNGVDFTPLRTSSDKVLASWNAFPANSCIDPVIAKPTVMRPNGSGNGQEFLSASVNGYFWNNQGLAATDPGTSSVCGPYVVPSGMADFSRSSSGPGSRQNNSGPAVFMPMGLDALGFAYTKPAGGTLVTDLSVVELQDLHNNGPQLINGVPVIACGIQTGSGTYGSWVGRLSIAEGADSGTDVCNNAGGVPDLDGRLQENNGPELTIKAGLLSSMSDDVCDGVVDNVAATCENAQLVVGFSASQYIARSNGVGTPDPGLEGPATSGFGTIAGDAGVSCTGPNSCSPVTALYNSAFGRTVYYVAEFAKVDNSGFFFDPDLVEMFVGPTSLMCSAGTTIEQHGFLQTTECGSIADGNRSNWRTP